MVRNYMSRLRMNRSPILARKTGGMLILVLVVLAVGLILITSAVLMTISTRSNFYGGAQASQARLTSLMTAQALAEAVTVTQEIPDIELERWANYSGDVGYASAIQLVLGRATSPSQGSEKADGHLAPGISGSSSGNSYTIARIYYTDSSREDIAIDVTTHIDALGDGQTSATERVVVTLGRIPPPEEYDAFAGMILAGAEGSSNVFNNVTVADVHPAAIQSAQPGGGNEARHRPPANASSNYVVLHGDFNMSQGSAALSSDIVYTGLVSSAGGITTTGNTVFYGDEAGVVDFQGNAVRPGGVLLFIGENLNQASVLRSADGSPRVNYSGGYAGGLWGEQGTYLYRTNFSGIVGNEGAFFSHNHPNSLFIDGGTVFTDTTTYTSSFYSDRTFNLNGTWTTPQSGNSGTPTTGAAAQDAFAGSVVQAAANQYLDSSFNPHNQLLLTTAQAISMTGYSESDVLNATDITEHRSATRTFTAGTYRVNSGVSFNGKWTFDLSGGDITLYVVGSSGTVFNMERNALIHFVNGGPYWGTMILEQGVSIEIIDNNQGNTSHAGIVATTRDLSDGGNRRSGYHTDGKPYLYIFGLGGNRIWAKQFASVEGYIGLYGNPAIAPGDAPGVFRGQNGPLIYGRVEAYTVENYQPGNLMSFPYCPAPTDDDGSSSGPTPIQSNYRVDAVEVVPPV